MTRLIVIAAALTMSWAIPAAALEADEVRGEIVSVETDQDVLRLRVEEAGDERHASAGTVNDYRIDADTEVTFEDTRESVLSTVTTGRMTVDDLAPGTEVVLRFQDVGGEYVARGVRSPDDDDMDTSADTGSQDRQTASAAGMSDQQLAQRDDRAGRDRLPDTASMLPLLALGGLGFAIVAFALRVMNRR